MTMLTIIIRCKSVSAADWPSSCQYIHVHVGLLLLLLFYVQVCSALVWSR